MHRDKKYDKIILFIIVATTPHIYYHKISPLNYGFYLSLTISYGKVGVWEDCFIRSHVFVNVQLD